VKRIGLAIAVLSLVGAAPAAATLSRDSPTAPATGPSGVHITPLSQATIPPVRADGEGIRIRTRGPKAMLVTSITVDPGGSFGWHTHPGPVLVSIGSGTLTLVEPNGHGCGVENVSAGQGFIEGGGDVHLARNDTSTPVRLNATFLAQPGTTEFLTTVPEPRQCHE
jgi:quercetin dioxygenase-like cupin family protein